MHTLRLILVTCFFSFLQAVTAHAQWPATPSAEIVISNAGGTEAEPTMVPDADNGTVIAWKTSDPSSNRSTLYVQRIDKLGNPRWGATGVAICATVYRYTPFAMTGDLAGGAFIVWSDDRLLPRYKLFAQHIDSNGVAQWPAEGVAVSDTAHTWSDIEPQIVRDDSGGLFVVFIRSGFGYGSISAQRLDSNGTRRWTPTDKDVTTGARDDRGLKIVKDGSGIVVVWYTSQALYPIWAQRFDQDGNNLWLTPKTVASPGTQGDFTIARGDSIPGGINSMVAVVWSSDGTNKIYAQAIDTGGTRLWGAGPVAVCTIAGNHARPRIINDLMYDGDSSSYYITWLDGRRSGVNGDIRAQRLSPAGVPQWTTDGVLISDKPNLFSTPSITGLPDGSVAIASYDGRPEGSGIYAYRIARDSTNLWGTAGVYISTRTVDPVLHTTSEILSECGVIFAYQDTYGNNVYLKMLNATGDFPSSVTSVDMFNSWNLISVPSEVSDSRKSVLYPSSVSSAYAYLPPPTGYASKETLRTGVGYWLKFPSAQAVPVEGLAIDRDTLGVSSGWNMIGTVSYSALTSDITPMGLLVIESSFFGFERVLGYLSEDTLKPGRGYWVKVNQGGNFIIRRSTNIQVASNTSRKSTLSEISATEGLSKLTWKDRAGRERVLLFSSIQKKIELGKFELPPQPPPEIFDVRFASQRSVEMTTPDVGEGGQDFPITVSGAEMPIVLTWDAINDDTGAVLEISFAEDQPRQIALKEAGSIVLNDDRILSATLHLTGVSSNEVPKAFALDQNYPNPFNPSTRVSFSLPLKSFASLKVYNALGREAAVLLSEELPAGTHVRHWNAGGFPTGVYFYRLVASAVPSGEAGTFVDTKKLILLK